MASENVLLNFVEYTKGMGDAVVGAGKEMAYGVYDFGQVAVGGAKIAAKEGLSAVGAGEMAKSITIEDIQPMSSLGKVASQGGYEGLGNAVKDMPGNVAGAVTDAAQNGDMRGLGKAVTDAALLGEGARVGVVGAAKGAGKAVAAAPAVAKATVTAATKTAATVATTAKAAAKTVAKTAKKAASKAKAKAAKSKAKKAKNPSLGNKACAGCDKKNAVAARKAKQEKSRFRGTIKYRTAEDANAELVDKHRATPETLPFKPGTTVAERQFVPGERFKMAMDKNQLKLLRDPSKIEGLGGWGTNETFGSQSEALSKMAIKPEWKPEGIPKVVELEVVKPFRTLEGIANPQGGELIGGAQQYFLDLPKTTAKEFVRVVDIKTLP